MPPFVYTEIVLNLLRLSSRTYQGNRGLLGNLLNIEDVYTRCCDERLIKRLDEKKKKKKKNVYAENQFVERHEYREELNHIDSCRSTENQKKLKIFFLLLKKKYIYIF